jgi:hypothetical protein
MQGELKSCPMCQRVSCGCTWPPKMLVMLQRVVCYPHMVWYEGDEYQWDGERYVYIGPIDG